MLEIGHLSAWRLMKAGKSEIEMFLTVYYSFKITINPGWIKDYQLNEEMALLQDNKAISSFMLLMITLSIIPQRRFA